jgi:hypothetical protein
MVSLWNITPQTHRTNLHPGNRSYLFYVDLKQWMWGGNCVIEETVQLLEAHGYFKVLETAKVITEEERQEYIDRWPKRKEKNMRSVCKIDGLKIQSRRWIYPHPLPIWHTSMWSLPKSKKGDARLSRFLRIKNENYDYPPMPRPNPKQHTNDSRSNHRSMVAHRSVKTQNTTAAHKTGSHTNKT